jgi:hypothetical protein
MERGRISFRHPGTQVSSTPRRGGEERESGEKDTSRNKEACIIILQAWKAESWGWSGDAVK